MDFSVRSNIGQMLRCSFQGPPPWLSPWNCAGWTDCKFGYMYNEVPDSFPPQKINPKNLQKLTNRTPPGGGSFLSIFCLSTRGIICAKGSLNFIKGLGNGKLLSDRHLWLKNNGQTSIGDYYIIRIIIRTQRRRYPQLSKFGKWTEMYMAVADSLPQAKLR